MTRVPRTRWLICSALLAISTHAFFTRMGMSVGIKPIQSEFGLTDLEVGWVLSAFIMGYGVVQLPVGVLTDRIGPHRLLAITVGLWSAFHGLTAFAGQLAWPPYWTLVEALAAVRFVMGIAQATVLPCAIKTISHWMPRMSAPPPTQSS